MFFCTVVVFVDKLPLSDMLLIYEHTTFASQNDVQNHDKKHQFHKALIMNYFPFLISTHHGDCRIFFYSLACAFGIIQDNT